MYVLSLVIFNVFYFISFVGPCVLSNSCVAKLTLTHTLLFFFSVCGSQSPITLTNILAKTLNVATSQHYVHAGPSHLPDSPDGLNSFLGSSFFRIHANGVTRPRRREQNAHDS